MPLANEYPEFVAIPRQAIDDPDELYKYLIALVGDLRALKLELVTQLTADGALYELQSNKGAASGYASLDANGLVPYAESPLSAWPRFAAHPGGSRAVSTGVFRSDIWDTEEFDKQGNFASHKFTVPSGQAGVYRFNAQATFQVAADGDQLIISLIKDASEYARHEIEAGGPARNAVSISRVLDLAVGAEIECQVTNANNNDAVDGGSALRTWFEGERIG